MPRVSILKAGQGTIMPSECIEAQRGSDVTVGLHPVPGFKVGSIVVDGEPRAATSLLRFQNIGADHEVSVTFLKTCVGRTLEYTLSNTSTGILVSGILEKQGTSCPEATLSISLFNPSNHLSIAFSLGGLCMARMSTDDLSAGGRRVHDVAASTEEDNGSRFSLAVNGPQARARVLSRDGESLLDTSFSLFSGEGAILEHGWVVAVDGSATDGHQYPLDLHDFVVEADDKSPVLLHGRQGSSSADQQSRRYVGTI